MSASGKAVFLSYASQDAEVAKRICEVLRLAGVEVWFDQSELVGGDAWDTKIRKQIAECALFVPVISANTQARKEGYFRLEWKLAAQRTHMMSEQIAFLLPVVIDATRDAEADVPGEFKAVQWTRIGSADSLAAFSARVKKLLCGSAVLQPALESSERGVKPRATPEAGRRIPAAAWIAVAVLGGAALYLALGPEKGAGAGARPTVTGKSVSAPLSEAQKLVAQARALYEPWDYAAREDFNLAEQLLDRAMALDPSDGGVCIASGLHSCGMVALGYDSSPARKQRARTHAERAVKLAPDDYRAHFALAFSYRFEPVLVEEGIRRLCQLADQNPTDRLLVRTAGAALRVVGRNEEALRYYERVAALPGGDAAAHFNRAMSLRDLGRMAEAEMAVDQAIAVNPPLGKAYTLKISLAIDLRGDLTEARTVLGKIPGRYLLEDGGAITASQVWLWSKEWDRCIAALVPARDYLETNIFTGPKAYRSGLAHLKAGRKDAAFVDWRAALRVVEQRLQDQPNAAHLLWWKGMLLASLGDRSAAMQILSAVEQQRSGGGGSVAAINLAQSHVALENLNRALDVLAPLARLGDGDDIKLGGTGYAYFARSMLRFDPSFDPLRGDPRFAALLASVDTRATSRSPAATAPAATTAVQKSVAVLAFKNLSGDPGREFFSDGLSEAVTDVLGRVPGLKVVGSASAFSFKGKSVPIPEIAQQLGVTHLVEGTVMQEGQTVRITAKLIQADGFQVWVSDKLDRELKNIFALHDEVAGLIAKSLSLKLGASSAAAKAAVDPEAFELYIKARQAWNLRTPADLDRAETALNRALALEPKFARAHAALADVWLSRQNILRWTGSVSENQSRAAVVDRAMKKINQALALDPDSAEAHASLGFALMFDGNNAAAESALRRAVALNPNSASGHSWLGRVLRGLAQMDQSLEQQKLATELDPLSPRIWQNFGYCLRHAGRPADGIKAFDRALSLQPGFFGALTGKCQALVELGRFPEAVALVRSLPRENAETVDTQIIIFARAGLKAEAEALLAARGSDNNYSFLRPRSLIALARIEEAMALATPNWFDPLDVTETLWDPIYDPVRNDPRWVKLMADTGLIEAHARAQAWRKAHPPEIGGRKTEDGERTPEGGSQKTEVGGRKK